MKNIIFVLSMLFSFQNCSNQNCDDFVFYKLLWDTYQSTGKPIEFKFNYVLSDFNKEGLMLGKILTESELKTVENTLEKGAYHVCNKINAKIAEIQKNRKFDEKRDLYVHVFSRPIYLSKTKACLFTYTISKNIKYKSGKAIGADQIIIYSKENGLWKIKEKKAMAWY